EWPETAAFARFVWSTDRPQGAQFTALKNDNALNAVLDIIPPRTELTDLWFATLKSNDIKTDAVPILVKSQDQRGSAKSRALQPNADGSPPQEFSIESPLVDAILQNTRGYSEGYPLGVPRNYKWCGGSYKSNAAPPDDFTAVVGWGQVYPKVGAEPDT